MAPKPLAVIGVAVLAGLLLGGAGDVQADPAVALLEKGLRERTEKWEFMEDIGFVYYWYRRDSLTAAFWFRKAGEVPGAAGWLRSLAANPVTRGGDRQSSRLMWEALR